MELTGTFNGQATMGKYDESKLSESEHTSTESRSLLARASDWLSSNLLLLVILIVQCYTLAVTEEAREYARYANSNSEDARSYAYDAYIWAESAGNSAIEAAVEAGAATNAAQMANDKLIDLKVYGIECN